MVKSVVDKDLEQILVFSHDVEVTGKNGEKELKVGKIEGHVKKVESLSARKLSTFQGSYWERVLIVYLNQDTQEENITSLRFSGASPVSAGDKIRAGLILTEELLKHHDNRGDTLYLEIINERGNYLRRDWSDNYIFHGSNRENLGLED